MSRLTEVVTLTGAFLLLFSTGPASEHLQGQANEPPPVIDVDGNEYRTVQIGSQLWMAENLRVSRDPGGRSIRSFFFQDDSVRYGVNGRLYTWGVAMNGQAGDGVQGICPDGWHLPFDTEWMELFTFLGEDQDRGAALLPGESSGFDALLSGGADARGSYLYAGEWAMFWSSTEAGKDRAYHHGVDSAGTEDRFAALKGARIHVRCLANPR